MTELLLMRDRMNRILQEYDRWFLIVAKFIGMMFVFTYVNSGLGYFAALNNIMVNILLSLICSIIPGSLSVFIVAALIVAHLMKLSVVLAILALFVMLIAYLMFLKFAPGQSVVLLAVPVLMQFNMHYMVPVLAGMFFSPYAMVPAVIGMFMVKFIRCTCDAVALTGTGMTIDMEGIAAGLEYIIGQLSADREIWVYAIAAAVAMAIIYVISQCSFDYAWYVAIVLGAVGQLIALFASALMLDAEVGIFGAVLSTILGALLAALLQFMKCTVDYDHKEYLQFEDDDYYYYVKAIPKTMVSEPKAKTRRKTSPEGENRRSR